MGFWEPKWIRKKIKISEGVEIETCVDIVTGLILCPICSDIDKICPSSTEPSTVQPPSNTTYLFSPIDLLHHLKAHRESAWKISTVEVEEEEESTEEESTEEEYY